MNTGCTRNRQVVMRELVIKQVSVKVIPKPNAPAPARQSVLESHKKSVPEIRPIVPLCHKPVKLVSKLNEMFVSLEPKEVCDASKVIQTVSIIGSGDQILLIHKILGLKHELHLSEVDGIPNQGRK